MAPVSLARESARIAVLPDPCDAIIILGSFWPYSRSDYPSHLVKAFKECSPASDYQPHVARMCDIYADLILERLGDASFDWVVRVLGSTERAPEPNRPLSLLESVLCTRLRARSITHLLYKSDSRPAMRFVQALSGPEVLDRRIRYAAQDLFVRPASLGGRALLIDDIYNTGASVRVYAHALKQFAGVESVTAVNLAATRFKAGRDGLGFLQLDVSPFESDPSLRLVWLDAAGVFHCNESCAALHGKVVARIAFHAQKKGTPCAACCQIRKLRRPFWDLLTRWAGPT